MNPTRACPRCGTPLPADAPQGHCPQCLLALAVQAQPGEATRAALEQATLDSGSARLGVPPSGGSGGGPAKAGTPNPSLQFTPGDKVRYFGNYELIEEIARGGMGVVWKARQVSLNRPVAVKMILSGQLANEAEVKRFRIEAEAAANLQHPNIVAIHEIGEHEGRHYFSMDLIAGPNLAQGIGNQPMPAQRAAELLETLAEAVHYAHQRGTLHRDLKPQNVLLDAEGRPHITDFGLAKQLTATNDLTQSGAVMGSPSYMPPEQALGRPADIGPASDVYSLGAILYQMLTGKVPFSGATAVDTLRAVVEQEPVAPAKLNDRVPADLETICLKCLEKKPERRYASARALAEELARFLNHEPILARPASMARRAVTWCRRHPWVITAAAAVLLLGLAGLAFGLWQQTRFLDWRHTHPKTKLAEARTLEFLAVVWTVTLVCFFPLVHYFDLFHKHRQQPQPKLRQRAWRAFWLGSFMTLLSLGLGLELIRRLVWSAWAWHEALAHVSAVFVLCWAGLILTWKSFGQHETVVFPYGDTQERPPAFKLEVNFAAFLFAYPIAHWLTLPLGKALVDWAQFQSPQGFLANGTYVFSPAMTADYHRSLAGLFVQLTNALAIAVPLGTAAWRSPRGDALRMFAPLGVGFSFSFACAFFRFFPAALAATTLLHGLVLGLIMAAVMQIRKIPATSGEARPRERMKVNEPAIRQMLPWVGLAMVACALVLGPEKWPQRVQGFATSLLVASIGVLAAGFKRQLTHQRGLSAGIVFFLLFLFLRGGDGVTDWKVLKDALPALGSGILAAYVLYRAASKPVPTMGLTKPQP